MIRSGSGLRGAREGAPMARYCQLSSRAQTDLHSSFGGIVPELPARHVEKL